MERKCPKCGLYNPAEAQRCDCGYDFESHQIERPYFVPRASPPTSKVEGILALGLHLLAVPFWLLRPWDAGPSPTPDVARQVEIFAMIFTGTMSVLWLALFVALVIWWRQSRTRLAARVAVAAVLAVFSPFTIVAILLLLFRPIRQSFIPPKHGSPERIW